MKARAKQINKMLIRREFWENRSLWMVPAVVAGILTVLSVYMLVAVLIGHSETVNNVDIANGPHFQLNNLPDFRDMDDSAISIFVRSGTLFLGIIFSGLMQIVVFFYLLDSLYAERRDRSVLFWRSMPVSDVRSVLAKLATALISVTAITFVATVALELVILVLLLIMGSVLGVHPWALLLHPGAFISSWLLLIYCLVVSAIWYLPYYGWNMLASSWAKKVPFLWSVLVPLGIMGAEGWVFHTFSFGRVFLRHAITWMRPAFNLELLNFRHLDDVQVNGSLVGLDNLGQLLASPDLWIGLVLAAGFVYGAIVLRRKRSEI